MDSTTAADPTLTKLWRTADDGHGVLLRITPACLDALGIEAGSAAVAAVEAGVAPPASKRRVSRPRGPVGATGRVRARPREGTKQALLVGMLGRAEGATIDEIVAAIGWQPHTVCGALPGALKRRLGLTIASEKVEGRGRVYRIGS